MSRGEPSRLRPYHHGNLASELVTAGLELVAGGGPAALSAREATRSCGVSVAALYRHFPSTDHWRAEVSRVAREQLAASMSAAVDAAADRPGEATSDPAAAAEARFRASGRAYIDFALAEPLVFQAAFMPCSAPPSHPDSPSAWHVLSECLDDLVTTGLLEATMREAAPLLAWTPVHGLAALLVQGAVDASGGPQDVGQAIDTVLDGVRRSLSLTEPEQPDPVAHR